MLKKIAILLFALLILQMALYARLYAEDIIQTTDQVLVASDANIQTGVDYDIESYLKGLGIETRVNEAELEAKYPSATTSVNRTSGETTIQLSNASSSYQLDIYDATKGLVASFVNLTSNQMQLTKDMFGAGNLLYKVSEGANLHCGTFVVN